MRPIRIVCCIAAIPLLATSIARQRSEAYGMDPSGVRLRIEVELDRPSCRVFENPTLSLRIVNPNSFAVILSGLSMGYMDPEVQVLGTDGNYHRLYYGAFDAASRHESVVVDANGIVEFHRFLYSYFDWQRWPNVPGVFTLRARSKVSQCRLMSDGNDIPIEWESTESAIRVEPMRAIDREGIAFLKQQLAASASNDTRAKFPGAFRASVFAEFLARYGDTVFGNEIRWEMVTLLARELDNQWSPLYDDPQMIRLWQNCLVFCLDRGIPYSSEVLNWRAEGGTAHNAMTLAARYDRFGLMKRIGAAIDAQQPDDHEGALYRHLWIAIETNALETARADLSRLKARYPQSRYLKPAESMVMFKKRSAKREPGRSGGS